MPISYGTPVEGGFGTTSITVTAPAGAWAIVAIVQTDTTAPTGLNDGSAYTAAGQYNNGSTFWTSWYLLGSGSGSHTIVITGGGGPHMSAAVAIGGVNAVDIAPAGVLSNFAGTGTDAVIGPNMVTTVAGDAILCAALSNALGTTPSAGTGYTGFTRTLNGYLWEYQTQASSGSITPTFTSGASDAYFINAISLKAASTSGIITAWLV